MYNIKTKNDAPQGLSRVSFMGLWVGGYLLLWIVSWAILEFRVYRGYPLNAEVAIISLTLIILGNAFVQKHAIKRFLKHSIRGWFRTNLIGVFFALMAFFGIVDSNKSSMILASLSLFTPLAFFQTACLWPHVKSAWLWLLANSVATLSFAFLFREYDKLLASHQLSILILVFGIIHGTVQATVMRYLWAHPKEIEKRKTEIAA